AGLGSARARPTASRPRLRVRAARRHTPRTGLRCPLLSRRPGRRPRPKVRGTTSVTRRRCATSLRCATWESRVLTSGSRTTWRCDPMFTVPELEEIRTLAYDKRADLEQHIETMGQISEALGRGE